VEPGSAYPEWVVKRLMRTGAVPIERHREVADQQSRHELSFVEQITT